MATEAQPAKQAKLLVVEDDVLIRTLLADMLGEIGYTVAVEAGSVDEALEENRLRSCHPRRQSRRPVRLTGCRRPRRPRHRVRLRHRLRPRVVRLSRSADAKKTIRDRCAEAVLQERSE